jgi:hypothetical protein
MPDINWDTAALAGSITLALTVFNTLALVVLLSRRK